MENIVGFIGGGNMGGAIIGGILKAGILEKDAIIVSDQMDASLDLMKSKYGVCTTKNNQEVAKKADILFLSVKPNVLYHVIEEIRDSIRTETILVSIVAGQSISSIEHAFEKEINLIRVMPNTPAMVAEGMSALSLNEQMNKEDKQASVTMIASMFNSFGKCEIVSEKLMDAVTGVSGSAPAFVFMMIEAMSDAAVFEGMPRAQAYKFAAQTVLGSAKMVLETGKHPGELKDMVTSPAGTTIEGVVTLERLGFRAAMMDAIINASEKSKKL